MTPLFRREAIEAHRQQWMGEVRLLRPVSMSLLVAVLVAVAVAVGCWLVLGEYTRKAHVRGVLVPDRGWIRLVTPQLATVAERRVVQGQAVRAGDVLFVLSLDQHVGDGNAQQRVQRSLRARQQSLSETLEARQRLESSREDRFAPSGQVNIKSEEVLALRAQLVSLERQRSTLMRDIAALEGQRRELPLQERARAGELRRAVQALAQESAENDAKPEMLIRAPQDGTLAAVLAEPGQSVSPDVALASLVPADTRLQAHLYAPSSALGFIRPQQPVRLRVAAFPHQKFGHQAGAVLQVSSIPLLAGELAALPLAVKPDEPLYRVTVNLEHQYVLAYGREQPLAAGMQLDADVMLERRRLVEWLFAPVLGIAGRL